MGSGEPAERMAEVLLRHLERRLAANPERERS